MPRQVNECNSPVYDSYGLKRRVPRINVVA